MKDRRIVLGSSSKFRQRVLTEMGYTFEIVPPDIDEKAIRFADPTELTMAIAQAKALALREKVTGDAIVIAADQVLCNKGVIREKPVSPDEAREFLRNSSSAPTECVTSLVVVNVATGKQASGTDITRVYMRDFPPEVIDHLIVHSEIMDCAGAVQVENPVFAQYVERIEGTIDSTMGLPKELTLRLMEEVS
ncbi:MAG TPA: Maf family protein [Verrucomicrobiae bacterium]|nr:Maf family protein [Verrucomicrobiae bacterium]